MGSRSTFVLTLVLTGLCAPVAAAATGPQPTAAVQADQTTITGIVQSSSAVTVVVKSNDEDYQLFTFDDAVVRPARLPVNARVRITSRAGETPGVRVATRVVVEQMPAAQSPRPADPVPASVRQLERQISRQAKRFGAGIRGGVGLDPELLSVGVHARVGPFFEKNIWFRPNLHFAYGEVTTMIALNLEGVYTLPITSPQSRWSFYTGAGPGLIFSRRSFEDQTEGLDFSDFDLDAGFNILAGMENRNGLFLEIKATAYAVPHVQMLVGVSF